MLSTPPALILSQDRTLILKCGSFRPESSFWLFRFYLCLGFVRFLKIFSEASASSVFLEFSGLEYTVYLSRFFCCRLGDSLFILSQLVVFVNNFFTYFLLLFVVFQRQLVYHIKTCYLCQQLFSFSLFPEEKNVSFHNSLFMIPYKEKRVLPGVSIQTTAAEYLISVGRPIDSRHPA